MTPPAVICLCYHAVSPSWPCSLAVTPEQLESQIRSLLRRGWKATTFTEAALRPQADRTMALTFDDAFASVLERAFPILSRLSVPATVFAPTSFMSKRQPLLWPGVDHWTATPHAHELSSMNWEDLRSLADHGWEVGSHTRTHPHLNDLADPELTDELARSREECESQLQRQCTSLAYPYGAANQKVSFAARDVGYLAAAVLGSPTCSRGSHCYPRIGVYHADSDFRFRAKIAARRAHSSPLRAAARSWQGRRRNGGSGLP